MIVTVEFVDKSKVDTVMSYETWKDMWKHKLYQGKSVKAVEVKSDTKHSVNRIEFS